MNHLTVSAALDVDANDVAPALRKIESALLVSGATRPSTSFDERRGVVAVTFDLRVDKSEDARYRVESVMAGVANSTAFTVMGFAYYGFAA